MLSSNFSLKTVIMSEKMKKKKKKDRQYTFESNLNTSFFFANHSQKNHYDVSFDLKLPLNYYI